MARPEQVLVLEPQHELKFRGNTGTEGRARGQVANLESAVTLMTASISPYVLIA